MLGQDECMRALVEAHMKNDASFDRESVHAVVAARLDEAVTWAIEYIGGSISDTTNNRTSHAVLKRVYHVLREAHDHTDVEPRKAPILRLGPGAPHVWDIHEEDLQ